MNKIPTAEELYDDFYNEQEKNNTLDGAIWEYKGDLMNMMNKFAKLHVQAALEAAYQNTIIEEQEIYDPLNGDSWNQYIVNSESILNAYPLENIK